MTNNVIYKKKVLKYWAIFKINLRARVAFFINVVARSLALVFRIWMYSQLFIAGYHSLEKTTIGSFTIGMTVWTIMFTQCFRSATRPRVFETINDEVKSGGIAYTLIKPLSFILFHYCGFMGRMLPGIATNLLVGVFLAYFFIGLIPITLSGIVAGVLLLFLGYTLDFLINLIIGLTAFWYENNEPFDKIYQHTQYVLGGLIVPVALFPDTLKIFAEYLPFSHLYYSASRIFVCFDEHLFITFLLIQSCWILFCGLLALILYTRGIRHVVLQGG